MAIKWLGWFGRITPEKRAASEVEDLDRQIYDAEKALHNARSMLRYLTERRTFLLTEYDLDPDFPPTSTDSLKEPSTASATILQSQAFFDGVAFMDALGRMKKH